MKPIRISPSLLSCNVLNLRQDINNVLDAGADMLHIDVMDGHYVPNLGFGPQNVKDIRSDFNCTLDVHLMVSNPHEIVPMFMDAGADRICFHPLTTPHAHKLIHMMHEHDIKAGIALNPADSLSGLESLVPYIDYVLVMGVNPGFSAQAFIPQTVQRIQKIRLLYPLLEIEVDGGVSLENTALLVQNGADILVAGSAIFNHSIEMKSQTTPVFNPYIEIIKSLKHSNYSNCSL